MNVVDWLDSPEGWYWHRQHFLPVRFLMLASDLGWVYDPGPLFQLKGMSDSGSGMCWTTRETYRGHFGFIPAIRPGERIPSHP